MKFLNSSSSFTIPKNTRKLSASAACILNVAHFVDSPLTSACHFSSLFENSCVVASGPKIFTASVSAVYPVLPLPAYSCCRTAGAAAVPVAPPISFPPTTLLCSVWFPPIITLFISCTGVPTLGAFPPVDNVVACFVSLRPAPPVIPIVRGADSGTLPFPQP